MATPETDPVQEPDTVLAPEVEVEAPAEVLVDDAPADGVPQEEISTDELLSQHESAPSAQGDEHLMAVMEAIIYVTDEPLTVDQIARALGQPKERVMLILDRLLSEYDRPERGLSIREVAGGYKMATRPEHHEAVRQFVRNLNPPLKLSLPALETLAVIAYKQPITAPEIMEIRGVQGAGVLKTLLDRKLITTAGRKAVIGKPILYKTTKEFLVQFGLKDLSELPTLKEFQELGRVDTEGALEATPEVAEQPILPMTETLAVEQAAERQEQ
jgi:segregation and condensation protein B